MPNEKQRNFYVLVVADEGDYPYLYLDPKDLEVGIEPPDVRDNVYKCVIDAELNLYEIETDGERCWIAKKGTSDEETLKALLKRLLTGAAYPARPVAIPATLLEKMDLDELRAMAAPFAWDGTPDRFTSTVTMAFLGSALGLLAAIGCGVFKVLNEVGTLTFIVAGAVLGGAWSVVDSLLFAKSRRRARDQERRNQG